MPYLFLLLLSSCSLFFGDKAIKSAKGEVYKISFKDESWVKSKDLQSDYVFENKADGRILLSNSFCNEFQDAPLNELAAKTFKSVGSFTSSGGEFTTFNKREAYKLQGKGEVDGVKVKLHILNTRRNNCYFDFVSIEPINDRTAANTDFERFLDSVEFQ